MRLEDVPKGLPFCWVHDPEVLKEEGGICQRPGCNRQAEFEIYFGLHCWIQPIEDIQHVYYIVCRPHFKELDG